MDHSAKEREINEQLRMAPPEMVFAAMAEDVLNGDVTVTIRDEGIMIFRCSHRGSQQLTVIVIRGEVPVSITDGAIFGSN